MVWFHSEYRLIVSNRIGLKLSSHFLTLDGEGKLASGTKGPLRLEFQSDNTKPASAPKHGMQYRSFVAFPCESCLSQVLGKIDPDNTPHVGGNTWAGGTGGRDTAGLGGKGMAGGDGAKRKKK
jgi:hypothetical protein